MVINLDFTQWSELNHLDTAQVVWRIIFWYFGWLPLAMTTIWGLLQVWLDERQGWFKSKQGLTILAVDVPPNNEQSPRSVENFFTYLAGAHKNPNLIERWWEGMVQWSFTLEIVSIDGYIQFIITTPDRFVNLVESAVYSQYPDAEITPIEDYTTAMPDNFPDKDYDIWGTELIPTAPQAYPIKLYPEFEHVFGPPETHYRDPMASLMDLLGSLKRGEQLWLQFVVIPTGFDWAKGGDKEVNKILGKNKSSTTVFGVVKNHLADLWGAVLGNYEAPKAKKEDEPLKMMQLEPRQKRKVEMIQSKASKLGFGIKIRAVYVSKKEVMNKNKVINGFFGWVKQFGDTDGNSFKPDTAKTYTTTAYLLTGARSNARKRRLMRAYKMRHSWLGRLPFIMVTDELATMWHFPVDAVVKAPLLQRAAERRIEPPMRLPVNAGEPTVDYEAIFAVDYNLPEGNGKAAQKGEKTFTDFLTDGEEKSDKDKDRPPDNLPMA